MKKINIIWVLIAINVLCFAIPREYYPLLTIHPEQREIGHILLGMFGHMFMHENVFHLILNMGFLYFMGEMLVLYISKWEILINYISIGLGVGLFYFGCYLSKENPPYLIGSSGVLFGFISYLGHVAPRKKLIVLYLFKMELFFFSLGMLLIELIALVSEMTTNVGGTMAHCFGWGLGLFFAVLSSSKKF